jgi:hydrogenase/urease accessory protein HupE
MTPACWFCCTLVLLGHNPDTSYVRVEIGAKAVKTRLTYDIFTLHMIVKLDDNNDRQVSRAELESHLPRIQQFLGEHIWLHVDAGDEEGTLGSLAGYVWPPDIGDAIQEADYHSANGLVILEFVRPVNTIPEEVALEFSFFDRFTSRHTVLGVFSIDGEEYETTFSQFEPEFTYVTGYESAAMLPVESGATAGAAPAPASSVPAAPTRERTRHSLVESLWRFFKLGVEHIFLGFDHICFLIALLVVSKFGDVVKIVTSFTIAHSITLILATLEVVELPSRLVEISIAATIIYVAIENLWVKDTRHRWWLTFCFGLVHGFGFASVLRELGLPKVGLIRCLLSFNLGVEAGQLAIALALLPLAMLLARWKHGRKVTIAVSIILACFGLVWFVERACGLTFLSS